MDELSTKRLTKFIEETFGCKVRNVEIDSDPKWGPVRENQFVRDAISGETYLVPEGIERTGEQAKLIKSNGEVKIVKVEDLSFFPKVGDRIKTLYFHDNPERRKTVPEEWSMFYFKATKERCGLFTKNAECTNIIIIYDDGEIVDTGLPCMKG